MTKPTPNKKQPKRRLTPVAVMMLAVFFSVASPAPAKALDLVEDIGEIIQTISLGTILTGISSFLSTVNYYMQQAGFSANQAATIGASTISTTAITNAMASVFNSQATDARVMAMAQATARAQADATFSPHSQACAVIRYEQALEHLGRRGILDGTLARFFSKRCAGVNADCQGPSQNQEIFNNLCQLGFIDKDKFGTLPASMNCKAPPDENYRNVVGNLSLLLSFTQLALPSACIYPDNLIGFVPPPKGNCLGGTKANVGTYNADSSQDPSLTAAFFLIIESLSPASTPVSGDRTATKTDIGQMVRAEISGGLQNTSVTDPLIRALTERLACPADLDGATATALGVTENCHDDQVELCHALLDNDQGGMGYQTDPALKNCDKNGLSKLKAFEIVTHCTDVNNMQNAAYNTGGNDAEFSRQAIAGCDAKRKAFDDFMKQEAQEITTMSKSAVDAQNNGVSTMGAAVPTAK